MNNLVSNFRGFEGRLNRQAFWLSAIVLAVVSFIISLVILPLLGLGIIPDMSVLTDTTRTPEQIAQVLQGTQARANWISLVLFLLFLYPSAAICIKRRHDRNSSGMDVWIYLGLTALTLLLQALGVGMSTIDIGGTLVPVPGPIISVLLFAIGIFGLYLFIVMGFLKGTTGPNNYGPDPLQG